MENHLVTFTKPKSVTIEHRKIPEVDENSMLVRTTKTLISAGTELTVLNGKFSRDSKWAAYACDNSFSNLPKNKKGPSSKQSVPGFPFVPGYNNVGTVIDVGKKVDKEWIGKKVASYSAHSAYVLVTPDDVRTIPEGISDEDAVFFTHAEITMNGVRRGKISWGEAVAVYGLGLLGQLAARFCHLAGARPVIGVDIAENRISLLPSKPGFEGKNPKKADIVSEIKKITRGRMTDTVIEITGNPDIIPEEFNILRNQGRLVMLSSPHGATRDFDFHDFCNAPSFEIIGAHNSSHPPISTPCNQWTQKRHAELFFDLVVSGEIDLKPLISHHASYSDAPDLYKMLLEDSSDTMGVILDWE